MSTRRYVSPKPIRAYEAGEYHAHVTDMYGERRRPSSKSKSPVPGVSVRRKTSVSGDGFQIRRVAGRAFAYVTYAELERLARDLGCPQSDLFNAFRMREWIVAKDRLEAEARYVTEKAIE